MRRWFRRLACDRASGMLSAYLDGYLEPRERAWLEGHLAGCARCGEELASLKATVALLQGLPQVEARRSFRVGPRPAPVPVPVWGWSALRLSTAVATVLLVAMVTADVLGRGVPRPAAQPAAPPTVAPAIPQGPAGPAETAAPEGLPALSAAPQETQPTPVPVPALGDLSTSIKYGVTPTPAPVPRAVAPPGTPAPRPTQAPVPATASPEAPTPLPRTFLVPAIWPLQAGLVGVWLALVALTAYRWHVRRKGV